MSTWLQCIHSAHGSHVRTPLASIRRRTAADHGRNHSPRWQRADEPCLVRVSGWTDLAQRWPETRLGPTHAPRPAGHAVPHGPGEDVPLGADPGSAGRDVHWGCRRAYRAPVTAL